MMFYASKGSRGVSGQGFPSARSHQRSVGGSGIQETGTDYIFLFSDSRFVFTRLAGEIVVVVTFVKIARCVKTR
jgi:hypothetical protein